jgi:hypothetical protein
MSMSAGLFRARSLASFEQRDDGHAVSMPQVEILLQPRYDFTGFHTRRAAASQ